MNRRTSLSIVRDLNVDKDLRRLRRCVVERNAWNLFLSNQNAARPHAGSKLNAEYVSFFQSGPKVEHSISNSVVFGFRDLQSCISKETAFSC